MYKHPGYIRKDSSVLRFNKGGCRSPGMQRGIEQGEANEGRLYITGSSICMALPGRHQSAANNDDVQNHFFRMQHHASEPDHGPYKGPGGMGITRRHVGSVEA